LDSREKALNLARLIDDKGALDISVIYIGELSSIADYIVLASGASERQVRSTAQFAIDEFKGLDQRPIGVEGTSNSCWVLVDYGDVILHVFLEELRAYYDMDALWADAPRIDTGIDAGKLKEVEPT
jgi:ribosome-associated protein